MMTLRGCSLHKGSCGLKRVAVLVAQCLGYFIVQTRKAQDAYLITSLLLA